MPFTTNVGKPEAVLQLGSIIDRKKKDGTVAYMAQIMILRDRKIVFVENRTFECHPAANAWLRKLEAEPAQPGALASARLEKRPSSNPLRKMSALVMFSTRRLVEILPLRRIDLYEEGSQILVCDMTEPVKKEATTFDATSLPWDFESYPPWTDPASASSHPARMPLALLSHARLLPRDQGSVLS